jgi:nucleoside-triphosphatase THEP1
MNALGKKEAKTTMPKKVEEMPVKPQNSKGVKKMPIPGKPKTIKLQESMEEFKVGDTVYPNVGPHKGQKHKIIAVKSNGYNIKPVSQNNIKYRLGAVMATKAQLSKTPLSETSIQESKLHSIIQQLIREELNMKEIDEVGKMADYQAKSKKISEEIMKRKKKLKALTTLEEIEKGSTNKDMLKSLKKEIKTLEGLKMKLDKKFTPKEEIIGEEETTEPVK